LTNKAGILTFTSSGRNTTLPHPEAKIGASACLTEDDIGVSRAMLRNRMSFMEKTQTRAMSGSSLITLDMQQMHNDTLTHSRSSSKSSSNDSQFGSHISKLALSSLRSAELTSHLGGGDHSPKDHHSVGSFSSEDASRDGHGHHHYNGGRRDSRRKRIVRKLLHRS